MNAAASPPDRLLLGRWTPWIAVIVLGAVCGAVFSASRETRRDPPGFMVPGRESSELDDAFVYDVERFKTIPAERLGYREVRQVKTGLERAVAVAVGMNDEILVAGDSSLVTIGGDGPRVLLFGDEPRCLAVSPEGYVFVGFDRRVQRASGLDVFRIPGEKARITSIAWGPDALYVADAGARVVWHFSRSGLLLGKLGERDPERNVPGFVVPSPYFDVLMAPDGLLRIVDPGRHKITAFTLDGDLELAWGKSTFALEGFSGCCNPSHIALLPDGRFVTSEKGIPRVKIHDSDGTFLTAVVGPDGLDTETGPCDVAVDRQGRVLVLDPGRGIVRIFEPKPEASDEE